MGWLSFQQVSFSYNSTPALAGVDLEIERGERVALVGPNGSGKTTLLRLACGALRPAQGKVVLEGREAGSIPRREMARRLALLPQQYSLPFAFTVLEVVMMGRIPFASLFSLKEGAEDRQAVEKALALTGSASLAPRLFNELSGGERQKVILAMALAQEPQLLLLDEPTAHLDIHHQGEILGAVKELNEKEGVTVLAALHDLTLAALYFPRLILLKEGRIWAEGSPSEVLTLENLRQVFGPSLAVFPNPATGTPLVIPIHENFSLTKKEDGS